MPDIERKELQFEATKTSGSVRAMLTRPEDARWLLVLAHGAGTGMRHRFMEALSAKLADHHVATFRYQFPYIEKGLKRPDLKPVLIATVRSAVSATQRLATDLPLLAGGKSMGGRMTSNAAAEEPLPNVRGLVFFGFPLHPPGEPATERADHLDAVSVPMLFLQGTRDTFADLELLRPVCRRLGKKATLHIIDGADHSFNVPKSSGRAVGDVLDELAASVVTFAESLS